MRKFCDLNWALQQISTYYVKYNQHMTKNQFIDRVRSTYLCGRVANAIELFKLLVQLKLIGVDQMERIIISSQGNLFLKYAILGSYELNSDQICFIACEYIIYMNNEVSEAISGFYEKDGRYICFSESIPLKCVSIVVELCYLGVLKEEQGEYSITSAYTWIYALPNKIQDEEDLEKRLEQQKQLGVKGERVALEFEKNRLEQLGYTMQSQLVRQVSKAYTNIGYDIMSFNAEGIIYDRFIEVKVIDMAGKFYWSSNEIYVASILKEQYYLYLVSETLANIKIKIINDPCNSFKIELIPVQYQVHLLKTEI